MERLGPKEALFEVGRHLYLAQLVYLWPVEKHMMQFLPDGGRLDLQRMRRELHGIFVHTLPSGKVEEGLAQFLRHQASIILDVDREQYAPQYAEQNVRDPAFIAGEREQTCSRITALQGVGMGGSLAQRIFAEVMSEILTTYVKTTFSRKWETPSQNEHILRAWVENDFSAFIAEILECMQEEAHIRGQGKVHDVHVDIEEWQEIGLGRLGALRSDELFNIVVEWDEGIRGAIEDLKLYIKNPTSRTHLTQTFSAVINHRLLQSGASTSEILQVYISIIRAFTFLDPKGVLLDRVARPVRRYLRDRDDTVSIVVGGLLADPEESSESPDALVELAVEMANHGSLMNNEGADADLDFDDMDWMPDPIDVGPDYKKSKNLDVIGSLISIFESKDVFVKEFQKTLGEQLLKREYEFDREIRVLELLKLRFGEAALQACEVMLRDILDSRRLDLAIHKDQQLQTVGPKYQPEKAPAMHARILSHLFWPSLHEDSFTVPPEITDLQNRYAAGFETIKQTRKLTWLHALGQVTVTLDLEDRTITEEVQTWQASVIHAFQPTPTEEEDASHLVTRTVADLVVTLQMPENLVLNALTFWVGKLVLKALSGTSRSYSVLETLNNEAAAQEGTKSAAIAAAAETATSAAAAAVLNEHEVAQEKMEVYAQYVVGMLTNGGAMPLQQIVMMLKLTVPGGFPFGGEELKDFLEGEVREGRLGFSGGAYRIVKA